jgi:hypothetical protein
MTQFIQKCNNTEIIAVNIPHRHDLDKAARIHLNIQALNRKLNKIAKLFSHFASVENYPILLNMACI